MKIVVLLFFLVLFSSCGSDLKNLLSPEKVVIKEGVTGIERWPTDSYPVKLVFPESARAQIEQTVIFVISDWNFASNLPLLTYEFKDYPVSLGSKNDAYYDGENRVYFQPGNQWSLINDNSSALAITMYHTYGDIIKHGDIVFNMSNSFSYSQNTPIDKFDFYSVLTHEVGHFVGVPHTSGAESIMAPYLFNGQQNRVLTSYDLDQIRTRYR